MANRSTTLEFEEHLRTKTISPPLYRASTVLFDSYEDLKAADAGRYEGVTYGTDRLPTQRAFERAMCELEGGAITRAFQSGIGAIVGTLLAYTKQGDHILLCDNAYGPSRSFSTNILAKFGIEVGFVPSTVGKDIEEHLKPNTRLVLLESPGSNTFELQDIRAVSAITRARGIVTVVDNTWATPLYMDPFALGADVSIHAVSKYIAGYSDVLLGTVTASDARAGELDKYYKTTETYAPTEDCYQALRGLQSLRVRLRQHEISALELATWLSEHRAVDRVLHPALPQHPEHVLWKRDFTGASGLFAFTLKSEPSAEKMAAFANGLQLFGIGYSWGGFKSLMVAGQYPRSLPSRYAGQTLIRLSIGLEEPEKLREDLDRGLQRLL
ncbi:MAG TPA: cystathionine beta-lyase [Steroidobacteraceae bacterium]|jgi:cystathionine beta-lyase